MAVNIFFCYAHEDEPYLNKLKAYLRPLQRQGLIDVWYDRDISAGTEWEQEISERLNQAQIILLLVSPDFMDSDYCYSVEMKRALERHERKEAMVIPVIVRPIYWQGVLGTIQALPTDAKPLVDRYWHTLDEALYDVAEGIRKVVVQLGTQPVSHSEVLPSQASKQESADGSLTALSPQPAKPTLIDKSDEFTLIRTLEGNSGVVWCVALDAKGTMLASGNNDTTIDIWDINRNELDSTLMGYTKGINEPPIADFGEIDVRQLDDTFRGHKEAVNCLAFSPNKSLLVSGSDDKTIKVWELYTSPGLERTLEGHKEAVNCLAFSSNGQIIVSGSDDRRIKVWYINTGRLRRTLIGHSAEVNSVAISADGQIISGSNDETIRVWNLETGKLLRSFVGHSKYVRSVSISADGKILASGGGDRIVKLWNPHTGQLLTSLEGFSKHVDEVAISADGKVLASYEDRTVKLWNPHTGQLLFTLEEDSGNISSITINFNGQMFAYCTGETIKIWERNE